MKDRIKEERREKWGMTRMVLKPDSAFCLVSSNVLLL